MTLVSKLSNKRQLIEFGKFIVVGLICTLIDTVVFYNLHKSIGYRPAMVAGFSISIVVNYILNIFWSFRKKPTFINAVGILGAHCLNIFVVRMSLMWLFIDCFFISEDVAFIPTLIISTITNFIIIRLLITKTQK